MERYMILIKPGGKCRLIRCDADGTLPLQTLAETWLLELEA